MIHLKCIDEIPLSEESVLDYENMAFDGYNYFFSIYDQWEIVLYDSCFCEKESVRTYRKYHAICYDTKEKCFWAVSRQYHYKLFKLNQHFQEIDSINIRSCIGYEENIVGISYDCCNDNILVASQKSIIRVSKHSGKSSVLQRITNKQITSVLALPPGYLITAIDSNMQYLYAYTKRDSLLWEHCIPEHYTIKNLNFNPCEKEDSGKAILEMLVINRDGASYICKQELYYCHLGFVPCECNFDICQNNCNEDTCHKYCCTDIIRSIALAETALAHILNAEGEKIQKIIACTNNIDEILCVNKEVNKTIIHATHLAHTFYDQLVLLNDYCNNCPSIQCQCICIEENSCCPCDCDCQCEGE